MLFPIPGGKDASRVKCHFYWLQKMCGPESAVLFGSIKKHCEANSWKCSVIVQTINESRIRLLHFLDNIILWLRLKSGIGQI